MQPVTPSEILTRFIKEKRWVRSSNKTVRYAAFLPTEPPEMHADITRWPEDKAKLRQIAIELAAEAQFKKSYTD